MMGAPVPEVPYTLSDMGDDAIGLLDHLGIDKPLTAMHESLCLDRFSRRWVQTLLPFRMPRVRSRSRR